MLQMFQVQVAQLLRVSDSPAVNELFPANLGLSSHSRKVYKSPTRALYLYCTCQNPSQDSSQENILTKQYSKAFGKTSSPTALLSNKFPVKPWLLHQTYTADYETPPPRTNPETRVHSPSQCAPLQCSSTDIPNASTLRSLPPCVRITVVGLAGNGEGFTRHGNGLTNQSWRVSSPPAGTLGWYAEDTTPRIVA